jgi:hypothetical protein
MLRQARPIYKYTWWLLQEILKEGIYMTRHIGILIPCNGIFFQPINFKNEIEVFCSIFIE